MNKKLYRDEYHKVFGGVCSGLAEYFDMDVTVVRLLFVFSFFAMGVGFLPYVVLWIVLPKKGYVYPGYNNPFVDYRVPPQQSAESSNVPPFRTDRFTNTNYDFSAPVNFPPARRSNAGIIAGTVLVVVGAIILANEFNFFPDFDLDKLWPIVLVVVGGALIASGQGKYPWQQENWHNQPVSKTANEQDQTEDTSAL